MKNENFQRGITLIALVVTIIILIILAGVSIAMVVGDNGIITQAQKAAEDTKLAQEKEAISLAILENELSGTELEIGTTLYSKTLANGNRWHILTNKNDGTPYGGRRPGGGREHGRPLYRQGEKGRPKGGGHPFPGL